MKQLVRQQLIIVLLVVDKQLVINKQLVIRQLVK
jgi:hypothetical protein